jgi:hypothetical protein
LRKTIEKKAQEPVPGLLSIDRKTGESTMSRRYIIISHHPRRGDPKRGGTGMLTSDEYCFTIDTTPHYVFIDDSEETEGKSTNKARVAHIMETLEKMNAKKRDP